MTHMIKTFAVVTLMAAGWLGVGAWVMTDLSTAKSSLDTVGRQQTAKCLALTGYAQR